MFASFRRGYGIVVNHILTGYFHIIYLSLYSNKTLSFTTINNEEMTKVTDHMANERTYLAWVRTGITIMALGFVVAKFGIIIRELVPNAPATSYHLSSTIDCACDCRRIHAGASLTQLYQEQEQHRKQHFCSLNCRRNFCGNHHAPDCRIVDCLSRLNFLIQPACVTCM
jgi:uncharacterized membrane protein YidH (DUF202 family)